MSRVTFIYVLLDPRTLMVRYVGKTVSRLSLRLSQHINQAHLPGHNTRRDNWIRSLRAIGLSPLIGKIEACGEDWSCREKYWIGRFRAEGVDLTNHADGGEGPAGAIRTPAQRKAMSVRLKIAAQDPKTREKLIAQLREATSRPGARERQSAHLKALAANADRRQRHSVLMKKRFEDPVLRAQAGERFRSYVPTQEQINARNEAVRAAYRDPAVRERQRAATVAVTSDPIFKARQRAAINAGIRNPEVQQRRAETLKAAPGYSEMLTRRNLAIRAAWAKRKANPL
jgi:hypothetical protein